MLFNETQETKNIEITFNCINKSVESLRNLTSFVKQYSEITKSYIEKIRLLLDKASSKLTLSHEELTTQNPEFTSTTLTNKLIQIVKVQNESMKNISLVDIENEKCLLQIDPLLEKAKKYVDNFNERKLKLSDKFRDTEKVKNKFFKEAYNTEKNLIQTMKQKHKSGKSQIKEEFTLKKQSKTKATTATPSTHNYENNIFLNDKSQTSSSNEISFPKLKEYEQRYLKSVNDSNSEHNEFNEAILQIIDFMIQLNKECNDYILDDINSMIMFIKGIHKITSLEIEGFLNDFSSGIDVLVEDSIKSNFITDNPIPKVEKEQYRITVIDYYKRKLQEKKTKLTEKDIKDIIKSIAYNIKIQNNEPTTQIREKTKIELEKLTTKLVSKEYAFFPLTKPDKNLLYDFLSDIKFRYLFLSMIKPSTRELELSNTQFQMFSDIFSFILDKSFSERDHISILNIFGLSEKFYRILPQSKHKRTILKRMKYLPLFKNINFWSFTIEQSIYEEIQANPINIENINETQIANEHLSSFVDVKIINYWFGITQALEIKVEFVEEILSRSISKFHLGDNSIKRMLFYLESEYFISKNIEDDLEDDEE